VSVSGRGRDVADRESVVVKEVLEKMCRVMTVTDAPLYARAFSDTLRTCPGNPGWYAESKWERFHDIRSDLPHTKGGFSRVSAVSCSKKHRLRE
jgi:hypothetical protein